MSALAASAVINVQPKKGDEILRTKISFSVLLALIGLAAFFVASFLYNVPIVTALLVGAGASTTVYFAIKAIPFVDRIVAATIGGALMVAYTAYHLMSFNVDVGTLMLAGLVFTGSLAALVFAKDQKRGFALFGSQRPLFGDNSPTMTSSTTSGIALTARRRL